MSNISKIIIFYAYSIDFWRRDSIIDKNINHRSEGEGMNDNTVRKIEFMINNSNDKNDDVIFVAPPQKNRDALLFEVYFEPRINSTKLANRLSVSLSNLNAIIKKINMCQEKPLEEIKIGKYKVFSLTEEGRRYVQNNLLNFLFENENDKKNIHQVVEVCKAFKDVYADCWTDFIKNRWNQEFNQNEQGEGVDAFEETLRLLSKVYISSKEKFDLLLNLILNDKEVRVIVTDYIVRNIKEYKRYGHLAVSLDADCKSLFELIDRMFQLLLEGKEFEWTEDTRDIMQELNQVKSDMLLALLNHWDKAELLDYWIEQEMEMPLAYYMAEKFYIIRYCLRERYMEEL